MPTSLEQVCALEQAVARIKRGERLEAAALIGLLGGQDAEGRATANLVLALAYVEVGDHPGARPFIERAFVLSGGSRKVLPLFVQIHRAVGDFRAIRAARKRVGILAAEAGDVARALEDFNAWHYTDSEGRGEDRYEYDLDILSAVRRLAEQHRRPVRPIAPLPGRRLRVAHLLFGTTQFNSVIVRISRLLAQFHDRSRFEMAFFAPESHAEVCRSLQGVGHLSFLQGQGCSVHAAPDLEKSTDRLLWVADAIRAFAPDLLVLNAALADFHHYFLLQLRPAPATLGFISGPPPQFAPPDLDWGIAWTWHPLMDAPFSCSHVPLETHLPDVGAVSLRPRTSLGIPEDAVVLGSAGRHVKHRSPGQWALVLSLLHSFPAARFLCVGAREDQLPEVGPMLAPFRDRIHFVPWIENYLEVFGQADIVLDTFPSGGGVALLDSMALGKPVVTFANDYGKPFDQTDWTPAQEFMPECDLVVPRGDEARYLEVAGRLIADAAYRRAMGERCRQTVFGRLGSPERMVRRCEDVFEMLIRSKAGLLADA
jgi:glycosyltransferase involved in cell wall biosynthesis